MRRAVFTLLFVLVPVAAGIFGLSGAANAQPGAGAGGGTWHVSRSPKLRVVVASGCPRSTRGYADVVNTFPGPPLVPASTPTAGIVCRYYGIPRQGSLGRATRLTPAQAASLARVIRELDLKKPSAVVMWSKVAQCPLDTGAVALIGFSYPARPDAGLWYATSGCQTLDNGRIGSFEAANPSFYAGFETLVNKLSAPLAS